jgi:hypothetical protein
VTETRDAEPPFVRNVTAVSGFAYGIIGADIVVFGDGRPVYVLVNWQTRPPEVSRQWLRALPSRMLNARYALVPFIGRDDELSRLRQWRDSGPELTVRWLYAPGGQGKTRLATEFANESAAAGWKVIAALRGQYADLPAPGSQDLRTDDAAGLLILVDYADRWPMSDLSWLLQNRLLHRAGRRTRVLMTARTSNAWPAVRHILDTYRAGTSSQSLPPLAKDGRERSDMFKAARDSFAAVYELPDTAGIEPPVQLTDPEFGLPLAVHMAALAAVDARATGRQLSLNTADTTTYLLDREELEWFRSEVQGENDLNAQIRALTERFIYGRDVPEPLLPQVADVSVYRAAILLQHALNSADLAVVSAATEMWQRILLYTPADHPDRAGRLSNLGVALQTRFERTGDPADLDAAIATVREAIQATSAEDPDRAGRLSNLSVALQASFGRTGDPADLDAAITAVGEAIQAAPAGHPDRAAMLSNLGVALRARFERTGDPADLDAAITAVGEAIQAAPTGHPDRAAMLSNLGVALRARFERTGDPADLDAAITAVGEAIQAVPAGQPELLENLEAARDLYQSLKRQGQYG